MKKGLRILGITVLGLLIASGCGKNEAVKINESELVSEAVTEAAEYKDDLSEKYLLVSERYQSEVADFATITNYEYTFDSQNRITKREAICDGKVRAVDYYDENENIVEHYENGSLVNKYVYENGKKVKEYRYYNGSYTSFSVYIEVAPGVIDEIIYDITADNPQGVRSNVWYRCEYNAYGDVERENQYFEDNFNAGHFYNYEYDENSNVISKSETSMIYDGFSERYTYMSLDEYLNK